MLRSVRLLTSARTARLPGPSVSLAACSVLSFKPQMATRAPSLSNSCAAASPIPLLPPVIRIFLSASLPIVVTPLNTPVYGHSAVQLQPMPEHSFHCSVSIRSDGYFSAIGEVRLWRHDDNVAVMQPLLYLNARFCLWAADDANALHDTFSDCPHIGFTFLNSDGTFWNCDTRLLRRRWLIFQEAHLGAHFRLDDL